MQLLKQLALTAGIPGREHRIRKLILKETDGLFDDVRVDPLGSIIAVRKPRPGGKAKAPAKPLRIMLAAHMDQIGFMVKHIDDKGFVRVNPVGGFDTRNLFARFVTICPDVNDPRKDIPGIMNPSGKPIHVATDEEKTKVPRIDEFYVDLGMDADAVKKRVKIGDMVVLQSPCATVGSSFVSQCMDNRVSCWIAIRALQKLKNHRCEIHCVFTVQEEVGLRGALAAAYDVTPDIGIALDTTLCIDTPGISDDLHTTKQGEGAGITVMDSSVINDLELVEEFERLAVKNKIKHQRSILGRGGTDAGAMQRSRGGVRTLTLSCPTRYIHTVTEMVHTDDLHACRDLLAAYLAQAG